MTDEHRKKSLMVTPEIFDGYDDDDKLSTLFHYVSAINDNIQLQNGKTNRRLRKLEDRKLVDKGLAMASGGVGGFVAMSAKWIAAKFLGL